MLVLVLIMGSFIGAGYYLLEKYWDLQLTEFAEVSASRLSRQLVSPLQASDYDALSSLLDAELLQKEIGGIIVREEDGEALLIGRQRDLNGGITTLEKPLEGDYFIQEEFVLNGSDTPLGKLEVFISRHYMKEELKYLLYIELGKLTVLVLFTLIFLRIAVTKLVIAPLRHLTEVTDNMGKGKLNTPLDIQSGDELQQLAAALDRLRASLSYAFKKLKG